MNRKMFAGAIVLLLLTGASCKQDGPGKPAPKKTAVWVNGTPTPMKTALQP